MKDKIIELARKIKALAESGESGEKQAAEFKLKEFMTKHGISEQDIEEEKRELYFFDIKRDKYDIDATLLNQICGSLNVMLKGPFNKNFKKTHGLKHDFAVVCTAFEYIEISARFEFYLNVLKKDINTFMYSFCYKHKLLIQSTDKNEKSFDMDEYIKALEMSKGLSDINYQKQINKSHEHK